MKSISKPALTQHLSVVLCNAKNSKVKNSGAAAAKNHFFFPIASSRVYAIEGGEVLADAVDFDVEGTLTNYVDIFSSRRQILPVRDYYHFLAKLKN